MVQLCPALQAGQNHAIFTRFPGFRYRSIRCANGSAALPIGARMVGKNAHSDKKSFLRNNFFTINKMHGRDLYLYSQYFIFFGFIFRLVNQAPFKKIFHFFQLFFQIIGFIRFINFVCISLFFFLLLLNF